MRIVEHHCLYSTSNNADIQSSELQSQESLAPKVGKTLLLPFLPACSRTTCGHLQSETVELILSSISKGFLMTGL